VSEDTGLQRDVVTIVRADEYDNIGDKLKKGIEAVGGLPNLENLRVVIKTNLCSTKSSETGTTISVDIVRELIRIINEKTRGNCTISVVESDAERISANYAFSFLDYTSLEKEFHNVKLVNLSKDAKTRIVLNEGKAFDILEIPKTLLDMEYMISIAKLKTHVDQRMSCILKNQFGLVTKKQKSCFHPFLSEVIFDLNDLYTPDLCIVDGIIGMEGFGPIDGTPKKANVIIVGTNPIATDIVASKVMGFKPKKIPHLKFAMKASGYKEDSFNLVGDDIRSVETRFEFIRLRHYLLARFGLRIQKWSIYLSNFGFFLQKIRSALSLVGFTTVNKKMSFKDIVGMAKRMVFRLPD